MKRVLLLQGWGFPAAVFSVLEDLLPAAVDVHAPERRMHKIVHRLPVLDSPTLVVGWSLGSQDALRLTIEQSRMVSGLVLLAGTPCFVNKPGWKAGMPQQVFDSFRQQVEQDTETAMRQFVRLNIGASADRMTRSYLEGQQCSRDRESLLAGLGELEQNDLRSVAAEVSVPVLLLHAVDDRVVPVEAGRWLANNISDARLVEYATGGHAFFVPHARDVAARIGEML
jgi:pimeloyl-[acyl-carrier protein] methyl ester esterase